MTQPNSTGRGARSRITFKQGRSLAWHDPDVQNLLGLLCEPPRPEQRLAAAILYTIIEDILDPPYSPIMHERAVQWLDNPQPDYVFGRANICEYLNLDQDWFLNIMSKYRHR